jgi:hypothetical protein
MCVVASWTIVFHFGVGGVFVNGENCHFGKKHHNKHGNDVNFPSPEYPHVMHIPSFPPELLKTRFKRVFACRRMLKTKKDIVVCRERERKEIPQLPQG